MAVQISGNDITVPRDTTVTRNLTVGGVLTYEDVTNVDSVGLITARNGIEVGASPGVAASISVDGNMIISGISTFAGDVQLQSDVSIVDTIYHSGDTNTAIRFPSNDTFTVETAGSESFRVDSSQRLLSGTLDIGYVSFADNLTLADSANCGITLRSGSSNQGNIYFSDGTGTGADTYRGMITYAHADNNMLFATNSVERLRIHSNGKITIGTGSRNTETTTGAVLIDRDITAESDSGDPNNYHLVIRSQTNSNTSKIGIGFVNTSDDDKLGA